MDKIVKILLITFLSLGIITTTSAQEQKSQKVIIKHADKWRVTAGINAQRLLGNVEMTHEDIVMYCDSAYFFEDINLIDGYGNVRIIKGDTLNLYSNFVTYNADTRWAKAKYNVKLINKSTTLTTDSLNYDMNTNIGYYDNYGTIIDSTTTLYSKIGEYHADFDKAFFKHEVKMVTPDYILESDTLIYETTTGIATIVGPTNIYNEQTNLFATSGTHNTQTGISNLYDRPVITSNEQNEQEITANRIFYDKIKGDVFAYGNVEMHDRPNQVIVKGNKVFYNEFSLQSVVSDSAQFWYYSSVDTIFVHADTLKTYPDIDPDQKIVQAFYGARFFRPDLQGKCDSMVYWTRDSTMQMFYEPVIWSEQNQMSSEYIEMITDDNENQTVLMFENSLIIAQRDSSKYNQIKGRDMTGHIRKKELHRIDVDGNGQSIYYLEDETGIIGVNELESSNIIIYLKDSKVRQIKYSNNPDGQTVPIHQVIDSEYRLNGFAWHANIRPMSQYDIFRRVGQPTKKYIPESAKNLNVEPSASNEPESESQNVNKAPENEKNQEEVSILEQEFNEEGQEIEIEEKTIEEEEKAPEETENILEKAKEAIEEVEIVPEETENMPEKEPESYRVLP